MIDFEFRGTYIDFMRTKSLFKPTIFCLIIDIFLITSRGVGGG